ncbi:MAG: gluconeogenesis factor YvcK family protein [Candidatus Firestonebacteria bacterium]
MKASGIVKWYNSKAAVRIWIFLILIAVVVFFIGFKGVLGSVVPELEFLKFISAKKASAFVREMVFRSSKYVTIDLVFIGLGIWGMYFAVKRGLYSILTVLKPSNKNDFVGSVYGRLKLTRGPKVAVIGGASGIMPVLQGLKKYTHNINAVILPTEKNIRSTLVALSDTKTLNKLLGYRFESAKLKEFNFGDLFVKAMKDVAGDTVSALNESANVFSLSGRIIPLTKDPVIVEFKVAGGKKVTEEEILIKNNLKVASVRIQTGNYRVNEQALEIIGNSDAVIIGPGSLYATILPSLLIKGVPEALFGSRGVKIFVLNMMAQRYEQDNHTASEQVRKVLDYAGEPVIDAIVVNKNGIPEEALLKYRRYKAEHILVDEEDLKEFEILVSKRSMLKFTEDGLIRHDPQALGRALIKLISI